MHKHRGNIIIMVLFILVASSAFALLMMQYTETMFSNTRATHDYNKAYYIAKGGVELGLADSLAGPVGQSHAIGYENSNDVEIRKQLGCEQAEKDEGLCDGTSKIIALDTYHTRSVEITEECIKENAFTLDSGDSLAFPLFITNKERKISEGIDKQINFKIVKIGGGIESGLTAGSFTERTAKEITQKGSFTKTIGNVGEYIILTNKKNNTKNFCLKSSTPIPRQNILVQGKGEYRDYSISLSASKKVTLPGFLFSTSIGKKKQ